MESILRFFPEKERQLLRNTTIKRIDLTEIRIKREGPIIFYENGIEYVIGKKGKRYASKKLGEYILEGENELHIVDGKGFQQLIEKISQYSLYAYENEIKQGFFTIEGGHRVGIAGKTIIEGGIVKTFLHPSSINLRISHQVIGAADTILPLLFHEDQTMENVLLVSPPGCGKTTILRDLIRQVSNGTKVINGRKIGVADERCELSGMYLGAVQNDLGIRSDVICGCRKLEAMQMLVRNMSPEVLAVDEICGREEAEALLEASHCGCNIIATMHGRNMKDVLQRKDVHILLEEEIIGRIVFLTQDEGIFQKKIFGKTEGKWKEIRKIS